MSRSLTALALATTFASSTAQSSDDYIDLGYAGHTSKFYNQTYHLKLSKELSDEIVGTLEYNKTYADWRDPGEYEELTSQTFLIDLYRVHPLNDQIHFFYGLGFNSSTFKHTYRPDNTGITTTTNQYPDGTALEATLGLRFVAPNGLNVSGQFTKINDLKGTTWNIDSSYEIDISYPVLDAVSVGLRQRNYKWGSGDLDFTSAYLRYLY